MVRVYTQQEIIEFLYDSSGFADYKEAKKRVMTRFEERQKTIKELEEKHVTDEYDLDIQSFFDYCDRMIAVWSDPDDEDKDEDEDEEEEEREYVESILNEAEVPKIVWDALWV